jgi:hypothetical protein
MGAIPTGAGRSGEEQSGRGPERPHRDSGSGRRVGGGDPNKNFYVLPGDTSLN